MHMKMLNGSEEWFMKVKLNQLVITIFLNKVPGLFDHVGHQHFLVERVDLAGIFDMVLGYN